MTRNEFVRLFFPSKKSVQLLFRWVKFGIFAFLAFLVVRIIFAISVSGWLLAGFVAMVFLALALLVSGYGRLKAWAFQTSKLRLHAFLLSFEKLANIALYMAVGIFLYKAWLRDPYEAYGIATVFGLLTLRDEFEKRISADSSPKTSIGTSNS